MTIATIKQSARKTAKDPVRFAKRMLMVRDKGRKLRRLRYNKAQQHFLENHTRRDLILKARQLGFSTMIQAEFFRLYTTAPEAALVMADKDENTAKFRRMVKLFYDKIPADMPKPIRSVDNASVAVYPGIGSEVNISTAGSATSGRASTYTLLHGSEVAFWKDGKTTIAGALQAVPEHLDNTWVVFESTANGAQGWFYNECMAALQGDSEWKLHFYAWWWDDDYRLPLEPNERIVYTDEERALVNKHGLSAEQIKWRRKKQRDLKGRFQQEYPETPEAAFIHSGQLAFYSIDDALTYGPDDVPETEPIPGDVYVMGIDWGQDQNFTAASVFNQTKQREVDLQRWRKMPYHMMRAEIVKMMQYWGISGVMPEANSMGKSQAEALYDEAYEAGLTDLVMTLFYASQPKKHEAVTLLEEGMGKLGVKLLDHPVGNAEIRAYQMRQSANGLYSYAGPDNSDTEDDEAAINDDTVIARLLAWYACNSMYF